jgi:phosphonoacetaldehyde hydrolase
VGVIDGGNEMGLSEAEFAALSEAERNTRRERVLARYWTAGAHAVLRSLVELPELIRGLNGRLRDGERP